MEPHFPSATVTETYSSDNQQSDASVVGSMDGDGPVEDVEVESRGLAQIVGKASAGETFSIIEKCLTSVGKSMPHVPYWLYHTFSQTISARYAGTTCIELAPRMPPNISKVFSS
jgi:hypothetical protein